MDNNLNNINISSNSNVNNNTDNTNNNNTNTNTNIKININKITNNTDACFYLGLDIGSVSASYALLNEQKELVKNGYAFHEGEVVKTLLSLLDIPELPAVKDIGYTSSSPDIFRGAVKIDPVVAVVNAVKHYYPGVRTVLAVGGEKFEVIFFDEEGNYQNYKTNTSCAAGTGSFLDQQARRLALSGIGEFSETAFANTGSVPGIASRCAVFAKTDLIHAQQGGYSLAEICDGLSKGLSVNICDTLFSGNNCRGPVLMIGGVSLNRAVIKHLQKILETTITADDNSHIFPAIGAALSVHSDAHENEMGHDGGSSGSSPLKKQREPSPVLSGRRCLQTPADIFSLARQEKKYSHPPLQLKLSAYPDFRGKESYLFHPRVATSGHVEIDLYEKPAAQQYKVIMGIDIGSTSTKACVIDARGNVLAGLYTRTAGQPLLAVRGIFEALQDIERQHGCSLNFAAVATTGSGRKFIGKIIGADLILDEITAHARAAYELDHEVDTIIEIGGQDAKFTTMTNGMVTFSAMNSVCAAGTGSFIEELAEKLGTPLSEFSRKAEKVMAPFTSDRCTVFMERDLNYYLREGYSINEVLASVLHSVRDNYLTNVATEKAIGKKVFFQGATAKNRALVAAFEQKLRRPIMVSKYCHLTGALGCALSLTSSYLLSDNLSDKSSDSLSGTSSGNLSDTGWAKTSFRGLALYKKDIPVRSEVCNLCSNHCKLKIARVEGEDLAYGFLCGRDYHQNHFVQESRVFDLIRYWKKTFAVAKPQQTVSNITIGLPAGLHLFDELPLWKMFFRQLGINYITSEDYLKASTDGKTISQAEFCSPMQALYGHVHYLLEKADYVFLPVYLFRHPEEKSLRRVYCYYTQFSSAVTTPLPDAGRVLSPVIRYTFGDIRIVYILYSELRRIIGNTISPRDVQKAYYAAMGFYNRKNKEIKEFYRNDVAENKDISVVLLGRPYTVLSRAMNKGIPEIINKLGIKTYYMDMLPRLSRKPAGLNAMLKAVHWHYSARILENAYTAARHQNIYPVFITSFKCTPDVFNMEYFKKIMEAHHKPYLILQLDEHDSSVGYETRIESALRSFKNHRHINEYEKNNNNDDDVKYDVNHDVSYDANHDVSDDDNYDPDDDNAPLSYSIEKYSADGLHSSDEKSPDISYLDNLWSPYRSILKSLFLGDLQPAVRDDIWSFSPPAEQRVTASPGPDKITFPEVIRSVAALRDKIILLPCCDHISSRLIEANLRSEGYDARVLEETDEIIRRSLQYNTGQCIPMNSIIEQVYQYVKKYDLNPADCVLWTFFSDIACNIRMYPYYMKETLEKFGGGYEKIQVFVGSLALVDFSVNISIDTYFAYVFTGMIRSMGCRIRPYELLKGETDQLINDAVNRLYNAYLAKEDKEKVMSEIVEQFKKIPRQGGGRPKVAIFGDIYVRDNDVMNQNLIKTIEDNGGEALTTSYSDYLKIIAGPYFRRWLTEGYYSAFAVMGVLFNTVRVMERRFARMSHEILGEPLDKVDAPVEKILSSLNIKICHTGESMDNILKIYSLTRHYDDIALFVQTNPAFCCASIVTEAMEKQIEDFTGIPVISITYDSTGGGKNDVIIPYIKFPRYYKN